MAALARVGLTESQAQTRGHQVKVATMPLAVSPRAKTLREIRLWNAVVDADSDKIRGPRCWGTSRGGHRSSAAGDAGRLRHQQVGDSVITHPHLGRGTQPVLRRPRLMWAAREPAGVPWHRLALALTVADLVAKLRLAN